MSLMQRFFFCIVVDINQQTAMPAVVSINVCGFDELQELYMHEGFGRRLQVNRLREQKPAAGAFPVVECTKDTH
ncbi:hypothetical protein [Leeia oryzae]|uniref:hypothetical protein n=1 Tax=Leeia oryzae TaxID=356662 RepID=UPI00035CF7A3|nr:hypothetical protein [Leeia oryzae]